jgi:PAS domain S-box-containing protein
MRWRDDFDLPARWSPVVPPLATEAIVAAAILAASLGLIFLLDPVIGDSAPFALAYPAIVMATLLAGARSGAAVLVVGQLVIWYFLLPERESFRFATTSALVGLVLTTLAQCLLVWAVAGYRRGLREVATHATARASHAEALLEREASLAEVRGNLAAIYSASADGLTLCRAIRSPEGRVVDYQVIELNPAHQALTGATREQMLGQPVSRVAPPVDPEWYRSAENALASGQMRQFDVRSDVTDRWLNIRVSPVSQDVFQQTFIDITDRHRLEEQRQRLLAEMNHRVLNNLQLVSSFLHVQARSAAPEARLQLQSAQARVQVLARLHRLLAYAKHDQTVDAGDYIANLCDQLTALIDRPGDIRIACRCESVTLATDKIVPLGMVIAELVTNAVKYAFPPPSAGVISVSLARAGDLWRLSVHDDGKASVDVAGNDPLQVAGGLGTRLVRSFVAEIGGEIVSSSESGFRYDIHFAA